MFIRFIPYSNTEKHFYTKLIARNVLRLGVGEATYVLGKKAVDVMLPDHNNEDVEDTTVDTVANIAVWAAPTLTTYAADTLVYPQLCALIDHTYDRAEAKKAQKIEKKEEKETKTESTSTK